MNIIGKALKGLLRFIILNSVKLPLEEGAKERLRLRKFGFWVSLVPFMVY
jgi:hypothetical protein